MPRSFDQNGKPVPVFQESYSDCNPQALLCVMSREIASVHLQGSPSVESSVAEKQQQQQNPESQDDKVDIAEESSLSQRQCGEGLSLTDRKARPSSSPGRTWSHKGRAAWRSGPPPSRLPHPAAFSSSLQFHHIPCDAPSPEPVRGQHSGC